MIQKFTTSDGLSLAFDDLGSGHPVLCLPGLSRNMADFQSVAEDFADRARIIRLDLRGRGLSQYDPEYANYTTVHEARDVLELLDHLGLEKVTILGTSRGGLISMGLAMVHPDRLHGVILNDVGPVVEPVGLAHIFSYLGIRPPYASYDDAADRLVEDMAPAFRNVSRVIWRRHAEALWIETADGLELRYDPMLRQAILDQVKDGALPDIWPFFDALKPFPLALIHGLNSNLLSAGTVAEMRRRHPEMIYAGVPDRGHVPFLDEPESVAAIDAYLERVA